MIRKKCIKCGGSSCPFLKKEPEPRYGLINDILCWFRDCKYDREKQYQTICIFGIVATIGNLILTALLLKRR